MYGYFLRLLPRPYADIACAIWFATLILMILVASVETPAPFYYADR